VATLRVPLARGTKSLTVTFSASAAELSFVSSALAEKVTVSDFVPFASGNRSVATVAAADQDRLLLSLRMQLQSLAFEKMRARLPENQTIVIESIKIEEERDEWTRFSAEIGTMTSELSLTMRAVVSALTLDEAAARQLVLAQLRAQRPPATELLLDSLHYARGPFSMGRAFGQARFEATGSVTVIAQLDRGALQAALAGRSVAEAQAWLAAAASIAQDPPPQLKLHPPGLRQMPPLPIRINLHIQDLGGP